MAPLTWLDSAAVRELMPTIEEQLDLVAETYVASARGRVELPPKPGLHPREDSFLNAMPAWLVDRDVVALKWVAAYPHNAAHSLPAISGLIVVNDAATGVPEVVMDAEEITAIRTAVASGVAIRHIAPSGWRRVAILGFGAQGRSHAEVVRTLHPGAELVAWGPRLVEPPRDTAPGIEVAPDPRSAVEGADVVITAGPMPRERQPVVAVDWLAEQCLVLPVDYDARVLPEVSHAADLFVVDDVPQFESFRERGAFDGWAAPSGSLGDALQQEPTGARRLVCSLGVGSVDAVVAGVVRDRARSTGTGVLLRP